MGREIKFRAWDDYNKTMITPYCELRDGAFWGEDTTNNHFYVKHDHVMQFTGLKDKDGKEIYEGDILRLSDGGYISHHRIYFDEKACRWIDERLEDGGSLTCYYGFDFVKKVNVIGNIHETPELLQS